MPDPHGGPVPPVEAVEPGRSGSSRGGVRPAAQGRVIARDRADGDAPPVTRNRAHDVAFPTWSREERAHGRTPC